MIYVGLVQPFNEKFKNRLELLNEFCVLLVSAFMPAFTDYGDEGGVDCLEAPDAASSKEKISLGWFLLSVIFVQCLLNLSVQGYFILKTLKAFICKRYRNRPPFRCLRRLLRLGSGTYRVTKVHDA